MISTGGSEQTELLMPLRVSGVQDAQLLVIVGLVT